VSPIDPRVLGSPGLPPEADVYRRLAELEARCAKLERNRAPAVSQFLPDAVTILASGSAQDLGGPEVSLTVPEGGAWVELFLSAEVQATGSGSFGPQLKLAEPTDSPSKVIVIQAQWQATWAWVASSPGFQSTASIIGFGGADKPIKGGRMCYFASPGVRTYRVYYATQNGFDGAARNRLLWARLAP